MTVVKICGIRTIADGLMCAEAGADLLGLNFYPPSPRYLEVDEAQEIVTALRTKLGDSCPVLVGVFVNESPQHITNVMDVVGLDYAQLSGDEPTTDLGVLNGRAFKALRPVDVEMATNSVWKIANYWLEDERVPIVLIDAYHPKLYGGTGEQASASVFQAVQQSAPRVMLAGGLTPDNVHQRIGELQPWGVDVASGVEDDSQMKDASKVKAFIDAARAE